MSPCGFPAPPSVPLGTLMNNTRLDYTAPPLPSFISSSPEQCLAFCMNETNCGGIVFGYSYEPIPVGCIGKLPTDGCCYPAPLSSSYQVIGPGGPVTYGFVSAIVRYAPPSPPEGIPPTWQPNYNMNASISLYWRNGTGLEPPEWFDGYGLVMFDWAHAAQYWINEFSPMDNAAGLAKQCEIIKARNPAIRCIVYRNTVIALNQHRHISSILDDPAFDNFFLKFKPNATQTGACWGIQDPRQNGSPYDPIWPTPVICEKLIDSDVHVPFCDKADSTKCNNIHYFDQNQVPQVPGKLRKNISFLVLLLVLLFLSLFLLLLLLLSLSLFLLLTYPPQTLSLIKKVIIGQTILWMFTKDSFVKRKLATAV